MDNGELVPNEIVTELMADEIASLKDVSWLLDGFPRTKTQAEELQRVAKLDMAINLDVPPEVIVERIRGRWTHLPSGRVYNTEFNPPRNPGIDDVTGEPLVQRDDDKPEVVLKRLQTYAKNVGPVLEYYRALNILHEFHGKESNEIWPRIHSFLSKYLPPKSGPFWAEKPEFQIGFWLDSRGVITRRQCTDIPENVNFLREKIFKYNLLLKRYRYFFFLAQDTEQFEYIF